MRQRLTRARASRSSDSPRMPAERPSVDLFPFSWRDRAACAAAASAASSRSASAAASLVSSPLAVSPPPCCTCRWLPVLRRSCSTAASQAPVQHPTTSYEEQRS